MGGFSTSDSCTRKEKLWSGETLENNYILHLFTLQIGFDHIQPKFDTSLEKTEREVIVSF